MSIPTTTVNRAQMIALQLNPDAVMASARIPNCPVCVRYEDDLITRYSNGGLSMSLGYFSEDQIHARRLFSKRLFELMKDTPFSKMRQEFEGAKQ